MESTRIEVEAGAEGQRLDRYLADQLSVSRKRVRHLLEVGRVHGRERLLELSNKSDSTAIGDVFEVDGAIRAEDERPVSRPDLPLEILASGEGWLVVNKPAGCGVHPLRPDQEDTVLNAVIARHPEILGIGESGLRSGVVHRLDVDTTGVLVFATDDRAWKRLRGAFSEHRVAKTYLALVAGRLESRKRLAVSLEVTQHHPARVSVVASGGVMCRQRVTPKRVFENATLVEVQLETGFLHQIRVTLAHLGHPILGDRDYALVSGASASEALESEADTSEAHTSDRGASEDSLVVDGNPVARPMLHASRLSVDDISVRVDPPADFEALVERLVPIDVEAEVAASAGSKPGSTSAAADGSISDSS